MTRESHSSPATGITLFRLILFSVGLFAVQTFWGFSMATMPLYLFEITESETLTGIILSGAGIFGILMPILSGVLSDKINTRWGRRKPFIITGWLLVIVILLLLPSVSSLVFIIPLTLLLYASFFTAMVPYFALLPDITPPDMRGLASGMMFFVGGIGILSYLFFGARAWDTSPETSFSFAAISIAVSVFIMFVGTSEPDNSPDSSSPKRFFNEIKKEKNALLLYAGMILWWSGTWMVNSLFVISAQELFGASVDEAVLGLFITTLAYVLFALPMGLLGDRVGQKRLMTWGLVSYGLIFFLVTLIREIHTAYFFMAIAGVDFAILLAVGYAFFLKLIPKDHAAGFVGIYMACQNGSLLVGPAIGGVLMDSFGAQLPFIGAGTLILIGFFIFSRIRE
jgi:Na+/melibiose symporter-like transporter